MGLPKVELPLYEKIVPSTGQKIYFRPFTVKENKILLQAIESESSDQISTAVKQILTLCIENLDVDTLALFDIEYLFLNIAAKSSGEIVEFIVKCKNCGEEHNYSINLTDIEIKLPNNGANAIKLDDNLGIMLKYPNIDVSKLISPEMNKIDLVNNVLMHCTDYIYDSESVYYPKDYSKEEFIEFVDSLTSDNLNCIKDWFDSIPEISEKIEFSCTKCNHENEYLVKGLESFL